MKVSCIILAGGKSSRMGKDKAFLPLNKKPLIAYVLATVKKLFDDIVVVVKSKRQKKKMEKFNVKVVEDDNELYSPLVGIKEGIKHVKNDYVFVIACDMPFIKEKIIHELISKVQDVDCVAYTWSKDKYEPLCAVYKKQIFNSCNTTESLHQVIKRIKNKILVPTSIEAVEFFNVNTKEDMKIARKMLS